MYIIVQYDDNLHTTVIQYIVSMAPLSKLEI